MAGEQTKKIQYQSWKQPRKEVQAQDLIQNMLKMGSPVVDRGGVMSWLKYNEQGIASEPMDKGNLMSEIAMTTDYLEQKWEKAVDEKGNQLQDSYGNPIKRMGVAIGDVPMRVIHTAYGLRKTGLWKLRGTLTHPILNKGGGYVIRNGLHWHEEERNGVMVKVAEIHLADGYDPETEYFFAIPESLISGLRDVPEKPTAKQVSAALDFIDEFFCDFRFSTDSAKASIIAFLLTMLCRAMIDGPVPMLEIRAAVSQSGKSLLVTMAIGAVTGENPSVFSPNFRDIPEFEKELLSQLMRGRNYIFMDDVTTKVQSSFLNMALKIGYVDKRLLGVNKMATVYSGMPFVMTANNPAMSDDIRNRIYLLDIDKPLEGTDFVHQRPESYAKEHQLEMLRSLFTLINYWKSEGRPLFKGWVIDGFIEWSRIIGGILQSVGIQDFLVDTKRQMREVDAATETAADLACKWHEKYGDIWLQVKDVLDLGQAAGYISEGDSQQQKIQKLRARLEKLRRAPLPGGYRFEHNTDERVRSSQWRVIKNGID